VTETGITQRTYNKPVIAGAILLVPPILFWVVVLVYRTVGIGNRLMEAFSGLERSQAGIVFMVTLVIGCPFFALPLTVIGRWLARVKGQRGVHLGSAVLTASVILLVLGLVLPLILK
jgi:hypothetical protein